MPQALIAIGLILIALGVTFLPRKEAVEVQTPEHVMIYQSEVTDRNKIVRREWQISHVEDQKRFYEMVAIVKGEQKLIGAWDTVRGEGLFFPEYKDFFALPPSSHEAR